MNKEEVRNSSIIDNEAESKIDLAFVRRTMSKDLTTVNEQGNRMLLVDSIRVMFNPIVIKSTKEYVDYVELLEIASELSFSLRSRDNYHRFSCLLDAVRSMIPHELNLGFLLHAVEALAMHNLHCMIPTEKSICDLFKSSVTSIIKGSKIVKCKNVPQHIPDFWLEIDKKNCPVEIKLGEFNKKALIQLTRYMNFYNSDFGIAVGNKLTTKLPSSIKFISIQELNEANGIKEKNYE